MPVGKPGTGYWSDTGWVEGKSRPASEVAQIDALVKRATGGGSSSSTSSSSKTTVIPGFKDNFGRPIYYDPTGGTDYPTSREQIAAGAAFGQEGEFPTYSVSSGGLPSYWGANLGFDVSKIAPTPSVNLPQQNPTVGSIAGVDGTVSYWQAMDEEQKKRMKEAKDQALALQSSEKAVKEKSLLSTLMNRESREQTIKKATTQSNIAQYQSDISARSAEINALTQNYNKLVAARDTQIAQTQDKYASVNFINNQIAQINRNAAPELNRISADINAKAAMLQVSQNQVESAQRYITQMVDAVSADYKDTYDMYRQLQSENETAYNNLREDYKEAYEARLSNAKEAYEFRRDEATKVGNLMLENPQAGIDPMDTLEEALAKVQRNPKAQKPDIQGSAAGGYFQQVYDPKTNSWKTRSVTNGNSGGSGVKLTSTELNTGATRLGITTDEFKNLDPQVQTYMVSTYGKTFADSLIDLQKGDTEYEEIKEAIDASNQPQAVKDYLTGVLDQNKPVEEEKTSIWQKFKNWWSGSTPASTGGQKKNLVYPDIKNNEDIQKTKEAVMSSYPFSNLAKTYINQATIGKQKNSSNDLLIKGVTSDGKMVPKGADFHNFVIKTIAPFSKTFSQFVLDHTKLLQSLDKANIEIKNTDPTILAHEMLHQYFENSPLAEKNPDLSKNKNAEKFGMTFLNLWDESALADPDSPLGQIDAKIQGEYDTENMAGSEVASEKFAYLGELVGKYGLNVIPPKLRPFYKQVFTFK